MSNRNGHQRQSGTTTGGSLVKKTVIAVALALCLATSGCLFGSHSSGYYDTLCVDPNSQLRVDYGLCTTNPAWIYYVPFGYSYPAYGQHITNYTVNNYHRPDSGTIHTGSLPSTAGKASKFSTGNSSVKKPSTPKATNRNQQKAPSFKKAPAPKVRR